MFIICLAYALPDFYPNTLLAPVRKVGSALSMFGGKQLCARLEFEHSTGMTHTQALHCMLSSRSHPPRISALAHRYSPTPHCTRAAAALVVSRSTACFGMPEFVGPVAITCEVYAATLHSGMDQLLSYTMSAVCWCPNVPALALRPTCVQNSRPFFVRQREALHQHGSI